MGKYLMIALLFPILALAQVPSQSSVHGIKIITAKADVVTGERQITFINDSTANITAYEVVAVNVHGDGSTSRSTITKELFNPEWAVQLRHRPFLPEAPPSGDVIHPGQSVTEKWSDTNGRTGSSEITAATIGVDVAIYSDGTAEALNSAQLQSFLRARIQMAVESESIAQVGHHVLDNQASNDANAFARMRDELAGAEHSAQPTPAWATKVLKKAADNPGVDGAFTGSLLEEIIVEHGKRGDKDQKRILNEFVADQEKIATAWRKSSQVKVVSQ